ncbi:cell division protein ZapA [Peribacillus deserti]|uniref:Cell division protein ZapA n=1 Tax=Peribacillus deserti TaxID=673318 RepID=A0A2N5M7A9_9BACI|nr:cell division protein ZapA [Peribacillus deserti]PLT30225.1 cell division protein ZapA [Peribacillus deserti]
MSDHSKRKITVDIYGQQYTIVGAESSSHIRIVASMVDDMMRDINSKNPRLDVSKVAVLTAVNVMHDYLKVKDELEQLKMLIRSEKD